MIDRKKTTVAVAMSGGVDSSLVAALLQDQGYNVIGITMLVSDKGRGFDINKTGDIASVESVRDAKRVAEVLGIRHYVLDLRQEFKERVADYFLSEYARGRTPNPCVICNRRVKFGELVPRAIELGADYLATGHYSRVGYDEKSARYLLKKGIDKAKDQSYVLYGLSQELLSHIMLPLGIYTKTEVRDLARKYALPVFNKPESQEICFIPNDDYKAYIQANNPTCLRPGDIVDINGKVLGRHKGVAMYTIGQRKGLGIAVGTPLFVIRLDAEKNQIVVGSSEQVFARSFIASDINWITMDKLTQPIHAVAKIRYGPRAFKATISPMDTCRVRVDFEEAQRAITPGQSVVIYDGDRVVGGGIIQFVLGKDE